MYGPLAVLQRGAAGVLVTPQEDDELMARQLVLIEASDVDWRLDERTREIGREGIAQARAALAEAIRRTHSVTSKVAA